MEVDLYDLLLLARDGLCILETRLCDLQAGILDFRTDCLKIVDNINCICDEMLSMIESLED